MFISGMQGLGDNIYQRSVIREIKERVHLRTSWPQFYSDLSHVKPVRPITYLRTQNKNIGKQDLKGITWYEAPAMPMTRLMYNANDLRFRSILETMTKRLGGIIPKIFDMPKFKGPEIKKPYAVIRPVTVRAEWPNYSRSPYSLYIKIAAEFIKKHGFKTVSIADLQEGKEWADNLPLCDVEYLKGELNLEDLMGLIQGASLVVGGVGWIVPAAIAAGVPLICILGGLGKFNAPETIISAPMDSGKTQFIYPDNFCRCTGMMHDCNKIITGFKKKFELCLKNL